MTTTIQFRRGTTAQVDAITPVSGEPVWETDGLKLAIGDASTAGGKHVMMGDVADYVAKALFDADTFLYASSDNTPVATSPANVLAALSGHAAAEFSFNTQKIGGVVDPTTAQQVATKAYADLHVLKSLFDAHTMLIAISDDTPVKLDVAASRIVGRKASGNIAAMTGAEVLALLTGANLDVGAFDVRGQTVTADGLTAGRVVFAGASGVLSDDSDFTFATDTLTVTKIAAFEATGLVTSSSTTGYKTTATFVPDSGRTNYAFSIGNRATELTVNLANAASQNLELFQMNVNLTASGGAPTSTSAVRLVRVRSTHDTVDMPNLRLMNINTYMDVQKNLQDAYGQMNGIDFYTNAITIGGEAAVAAFNIDANSAVTGKVRGVIINVYGGGLPASTSIGLEVRTDGGAATLGEGVRIWSVGGNSINYGLYIDGTINTADIRFSGGATLVDDGTWLTLAGSKLKVSAPDISGTVTAVSALTMPAFAIGSADGLDINPGSDANVDLITVGVTGAPKITWHENQDKFYVTKPLWVAGRISATAATPSGIYRDEFGTDFTSDGSSTAAAKVNISGTLTGATGDISFLCGLRFAGAITTQNNGETIGYIANLVVNEPNIVKGTDTVTVAASIYIPSAPTEGVTNAALYVASGMTNLQGGLLVDAGSGNVQIDTTGALALLLKAALKFDQTDDSAAVADEVSLSGYEISSGHRALAISSEEVEVAENDESKFSHVFPMRVNGATRYFMMIDSL